jgi:hypothetical protein
MYKPVLQVSHTVELLQTSQYPFASHGVQSPKSKNVPELQTLHTFGLPVTHNSHPLTLQSGIHQPFSSGLYPGAHSQALPYLLETVNIPPAVPGGSNLHSSQHLPTKRNGVSEGQGIHL